MISMREISPRIPGNSGVTFTVHSLVSGKLWASVVFYVIFEVARCL